MVLLPVYAVEYAWGVDGKKFRCFVSGIDAQVGGMTHLSETDAVMRGGVVGAAGGMVAAWLTDNAMAWAMVDVLGGTLVGSLAGFLMAQHRAASWEQAGRKREEDVEKNRR